MFESFATSPTRRRFAGIAVLCLALTTVSATAGRRGQYGGDLDFLRSFYVPPQVAGESNFYFDLWTPGSLPALGRVNGLTNNHALFVDSHGKGGCVGSSSGYGFYPNDALLRPGQRTPYYSARDLAEVMGRAHAAKIHNIVSAGCNEEGRFSSAEVREYFPNATNITYMTAGHLAYKPMFYQAIVLPSSEIKPLYGKVKSRAGRVECDIFREPAPGAERLGTFMADLYRPGARRPFQTQPAGRELLDPASVRAGFAAHHAVAAATAIAYASASERRTVAQPVVAARRSVAPLIISQPKPARPAPLSVAERSTPSLLWDFLVETVQASVAR